MRSYREVTGGIFWGLLIFLQVLTVGLNTVLYLEGMYQQTLRYQNIQSSIQLKDWQIYENFQEMGMYLKPCGVWQEGDLDLPHLTISEKGRQHFREVRSCYRIMDFTFILCSLLIILLRRRLTIRKLAISGLTVLGVTGLLIAVTMIDFGSIFEELHYLLFSNSYWQMNPFEDPIILFLPKAYFRYCAIVTLLMELGTAVIIFIQYHILKRAEFKQDKIYTI